MNYYDILEISQQATSDEIKRAYRKLSLQYHPDREGGDTTKFQNISQAYETLNDLEKRQMYDNKDNDKDNYNNNNQTTQDIFNMFFRTNTNIGINIPGLGGSVHFTPFNNRHMFNKTKRYQVNITLAEAYTGTTYDLGIERLIVENFTERHEAVNLRFMIPPGSVHQSVHLIPKQGNIINGIQEDVEVIFFIVPHASFAVSGNNLIYNATISLKEALCGFVLDIPHISGRMAKYEVAKIISPQNEKKIIKNYGMPIQNEQGGQFGDLIIIFTIQFPTKLTDDQRSELFKIL